MKTVPQKLVNFATITSPYSLVADSDVQYYSFYGTKTLPNNFIIQASGTPKEGSIVCCSFHTAITPATYTLTVLGRVINEKTVVGDFGTLSLYSNAVWTTFVYNWPKEADGVKIKDTNGSLSINPGSLADVDISAGAAIDYAKLALTGKITNADIAAAAAIAYAKLALTGSITNADIATAAAIVYSKLSLTGSVVNADIAAAAAIAYSKLALTNSIVNADIAAAAAITYSKLVLTGALVDSDVSTSAAIARTKLAALTANRAVVTNASGVEIASAVTDTELGYLAGVTSNLQTQLNAVVASKVTRATLSGTTILTVPLKTTYFCDVSGGGFTVTLPIANTVTADTIIEFIVWGHNTNVLTISRGGTDLIDAAASIGGTSLTSSGYDAGYRLICDGSSKWTAIKS